MNDDALVILLRLFKLLEENYNELPDDIKKEIQALSNILEG